MILIRNIYNISNPSDLKMNAKDKVFIKSSDKFKDFTEIVSVSDIPLDKNFIISDLIDITSEWRGFIYNNRLVDIRNYSGDFAIFPDINIVKEMISCYKNSPKAYTIDVGITKEGHTVLIECHLFKQLGIKMPRF